MAILAERVQTIAISSQTLVMTRICVPTMYVIAMEPVRTRRLIATTETAVPTIPATRVLDAYLPPLLGKAAMTTMRARVVTNATLQEPALERR